MTPQIVAFMFAVSLAAVIALSVWSVLAIVEALNNIGAAVRGQVVKPVSIVPPSWGKRH